MLPGDFLDSATIFLYIAPMNQVPPPNDGYKYYYFGTLIEPLVYDDWIYVRNDGSDYRKMHRHKYPRAQEVLHTIQALEGKEAILRTRVTGDYDFDPAKVFFSDVYPADELAEGWPRDGDESSLSIIVHLRLTMKEREQAAKRYEERMERYRKSMIADLNAAQAQLTRSEELYKKDVWNSRLERLCEYDPKIEEELPDNAWMMTLDEVMEYLDDTDISHWWDDPMDEMVDITDFRRRHAV